MTKRQVPLLKRWSVNEQSLYRTIDANFNRTKEGLRVCEDLCRFVLNDQTKTKDYKKLRHQLSEVISDLGFKDLVSARNIEEDVGRGSVHSELKRNNCADIFYANSQRVKESLRVLEEFSKLIKVEVAVQLKKMRYRMYALEKKIIAKF